MTAVSALAGNTPRPTGNRPGLPRMTAPGADDPLPQMGTEDSRRSRSGDVASCVHDVNCRAGVADSGRRSQELV
jgi:hypothetical protein